MDASPPRAVTIYDVAAAAGVAPSTVSRAFSRPGRVNSVTAQRIREVADRLGYRTNVVARALSTARTRMLAVAVPDVANPFFAEIIRGAQLAAAESGYTILLADTRESERLERESLERVLPTVDGVLLAGSRMSDATIRLIATQRPVVVLNRAVVDVPCVVVDNARGVALAVAHLQELGHRSITYVAGPEASWADGMRWRSLLEVTADRGIRARRLGPCSPDVPGGLRMAELLAARPRSAVLAYNDQVAIGLVRGLTDRGVRVPRDVSVVGFDDIASAALVTPGLTTVAAPLRHEGETATRHLLRLVEGERERIGPPVVLPVRLVVRGSTAQRNRKRTSPASGTTSVSPSAAKASRSTAAGSR